MEERQKSLQRAGAVVCSNQRKARGEGSATAGTEKGGHCARPQAAYVAAPALGVNAHHRSARQEPTRAPTSVFADSVAVLAPAHNRVG